MSCWVDAYILQESIYATILLGKDDNRYGLLSMLHSPLRLICMLFCFHAVPNETMQRVRCFSSLLWCILVCGFFLQMECTCMARVLGMFLCTVLFG